MSSSRRVSVTTLGCARNEVDSEEIAGRLEAAGWQLVDEQSAPDVAVVNTCGFVASAKKDSIDTLLAAGDSGARVVAVGCLAERYGKDLAEQLPEADAVLGFDSYADLSTHLQSVLDGVPVPSHVPADRRRLLPLAPVARQEAGWRRPGWRRPGWSQLDRRRADRSPGCRTPGLVWAARGCCAGGWTAARSLR